MGETIWLLNRFNQVCWIWLQEGSFAHRTVPKRIFMSLHMETMYKCISNFNY